jgi:hypothetical protein
VKNLLLNDTIGIRPQRNIDLGMIFFEEGKERRKNSRRRAIGSTHLQRATLRLRKAVQIALIDLFELC